MRKLRSKLYIVLCSTGVMLSLALVEQVLSL